MIFCIYFYKYVKKGASHQRGIFGKKGIEDDLWKRYENPDDIATSEK